MNEPMMAGSQHKTEASSLGASSNSHHISRIKSNPCFGRGKQCAPLLDILTLGWQLSTGLNGQHISIDQNLSENAASLVLAHYAASAPYRVLVEASIRAAGWLRDGRSGDRRALNDRWHRRCTPAGAFGGAARQWRTGHHVALPHPPDSGRGRSTTCCHGTWAATIT